LRGKECRGNLGGALGECFVSPHLPPPRLLRFARKDSVGYVVIASLTALSLCSS